MPESLERVVFVSVIHTETDSVDYARKIVRKVKPDVVAVELDRERYEQLISSQSSTEIPEMPITGDVVHNLLNQIAMLENSLSGITGTGVGEEMLTAIKEGRKIGAKIALVDRPISATVHALRQVPLDEIYRLTSLVPDATAEIEGGSAQDLMSFLKEDGSVDALMEQFKDEFPLLHEALIHQRDLYIAKALLSILNDVEGNIVVVLGAGHTEGVRKTLGQLLETEAGS